MSHTINRLKTFPAAAGTLLSDAGFSGAADARENDSAGAFTTSA